MLKAAQRLTKKQSRRTAGHLSGKTGIGGMMSTNTTAAGEDENAVRALTGTGTGTIGSADSATAEAVALTDTGGTPFFTTILSSHSAVHHAQMA